MSHKLFSTQNHTHTEISFFDRFTENNFQKSQKSSISTHTESHFFAKKVKSPPAGQVCKSQNQNKKTYAYRLLVIIPYHEPPKT